MLSEDVEWFVFENLHPYRDSHLRNHFLLKNRMTIYLIKLGRHGIGIVWSTDPDRFYQLTGLFFLCVVCTHKHKSIVNIQCVQRWVEMASHCKWLGARSHTLTHIAQTHTHTFILSLLLLFLSLRISYIFTCSSLADVIFVGFILFMAAANKAILLKNHYATKDAGMIRAADEMK